MFVGRLSLILACLPLMAAASNLVAVSTMPGLLCGDLQDSKCGVLHQRQISQALLPSLLQHLSSGTTHPDLPLEQTSVVPELVVLVTSRHIADPSALVDRISAAVQGVSSFQASTDRHTSEADLWALDARSISSVESLSSVAAADEENLLANGISEVLTITTSESNESLFQTLRTLAEKTSGKLAVIWTTREDTPEEAAAPDGQVDKNDDDSESLGAKASENSMNPPEINTAQLTGLLVVLIFLILFVPGFMCLWNIQPPQSFDVFDSNDVKKKLQ